MQITVVPEHKTARLRPVHVVTAAVAKRSALLMLKDHLDKTPQAV